MGGRQVICRGNGCSAFPTQNPNDSLLIQYRALGPKVGLESLWDPSQAGREFQIYK